ncbi:MAG: hypothetical protein V2A54_04195 [Bacteroidota bacterium]
MNTKKYFFALVAVSFCLLSFGQKDSACRFRIILNPTNSLFNQHTIGIEHPINSTYSVGAGFGIFTPFCWWNPDHALYNGTDDKYPTGVYNGWMIDGSFIKNLKVKGTFVQTTAFFKYLYYEDILFENSFGDPNPYVAWRRSEIARVFGLKYLYGYKKNIAKHLAIETFFGFSMRCRIRSYVDSWKNQGWSWGVQHRVQIFPGLQFGVMLSLGDFKL